MLALARYALKGPLHAATVAGVLAILSLFIPLVSVLSGAVVGLIILTQGLVSGVRVILVSIVGITVVVYLVTGSPIYGVTIGLVQWLPMVLLAEVLRRTSSLSFTLLVGMGASLLAVILQFTLWPDSEQLWMQYLLQLFSDLDQPGVDAQQLQQTLQVMVHWMTIVLVAVMYGTFVATLMVARWFQAKLAGSDGYRNEFYAISFGRSAAAVTLVVVVAAVLLKQNWLSAMAIVMLSAFFYQGLAIAHNWSKVRSKQLLLFLLYVLMIIMPQAVAGTALLGILDNWMDFRKNLKDHPRETD